MQSSVGGITTVHEIIRQYQSLVPFLGAVLGTDYEVVLHDLSSDDNKVVAIANSGISGRKVGAPLTNLALKFIADRTYQTKDFVVGSPGISPKGAPLLTATYFIKDGAKALIGILCINCDMTHFNHLLDSLSGLVGLNAAAQAAPAAAPATERFQGSIKDLVRSSIDEIVARRGVPADRLTMSEKIMVVEELNRDGVFFLKGAVSEVAGYLQSSEATIYRYLSKLR